MIPYKYYETSYELSHTKLVVACSQGDQCKALMNMKKQY